MCAEKNSPEIPNWILVGTAGSLATPWPDEFITVPVLVVVGTGVGTVWLINKYGPSAVDRFGSLFSKKDKFKGGKQGKRDKTFGKGKDFWDWYHDVKGGKKYPDIGSQGDADDWEETWKGEEGK